MSKPTIALDSFSLLGTLALMACAAAASVAVSRAEAAPRAKKAPAATARHVKHGRVIDFEDGVVEAMNQRPLDSVTQTSESDKKRPTHHLYRLRAGFSSETGETVQQVRYH